MPPAFGWILSRHTNERHPEDGMAGDFDVQGEIQQVAYWRRKYHTTLSDFPQTRRLAEFRRHSHRKRAFLCFVVHSFFTFLFSDFISPSAQDGENEWDCLLSRQQLCLKWTMQHKLPQTEHKQMEYIIGVKVYFHTHTRPFVIPHSCIFRGAVMCLAVNASSFMRK